MSPCDPLDDLGILSSLHDHLLKSLESMPWLQQAPLALCKHILTKHYGQDLIGRVVSRMACLQDSWDTPKQFTYAHVSALLAGIATQVTTRDLDHYLAERALPSFSDADASTRSTALQFFRPQRLMSLIHERKWLTKHPFNQDENLHACLKFLNSQACVRDWASPSAHVEYLAHHMGYVNLEAGSVFTAYMDGQRHHFGVLDRFASGGIDTLARPYAAGLNALICRCFTHSNANNRYIILRGWDGCERIREKHSPGHYSYRHLERQLLQCIGRHLSSEIQGVHIYGHSMGGSDSQRLARTFAEGMAASRSSVSQPLPEKIARWQHPDSFYGPLLPKLSGLTRVNCYLWNTSGVSFEDNERFHQALKILLEQGVQFAVDAHHVQGDWIAETGDVILGAGARPANLQRHLYQLRSQYVQSGLFFTSRIWRAHSSDHQNTPNRHHVKAITHSHDPEPHSKAPLIDHPLHTFFRSAHFEDSRRDVGKPSSLQRYLNWLLRGFSADAEALEQYSHFGAKTSFGHKKRQA